MTMNGDAVFGLADVDHAGDVLALELHRRRAPRDRSARRRPASACTSRRRNLSATRSSSWPGASPRRRCPCRLRRRCARCGTFPRALAPERPARRQALASRGSKYSRPPLTTSNPTMGLRRNVRLPSRFPGSERTTSPYIDGRDSRRIPKGRLGRFARLAAAGARSGAGLLLSRTAQRAAQSTAEVARHAPRARREGRTDGELRRRRRPRSSTATPTRLAM